MPKYPRREPFSHILLPGEFVKSAKILFCGLFFFILLGSSCSSIQKGLYISLIDKLSGDQVLENESNVKAFLKNIIKTPDDYLFLAYERTAVLYQVKRTKLLTHTYYLIIDKKTDEFYTLSYYGTKVAAYSRGAWMMNSDLDMSSYSSYISGKKSWDVARIDIDIDTLGTTQKIIEKMVSGISYYYRAHIKNKPGVDNCNTALWETLVMKKDSVSFIPLQTSR